MHVSANVALKQRLLSRRSLMSQLDDERQKLGIFAGQIYSLRRLSR
jgi:hypothetical protein